MTNQLKRRDFLLHFSIFVGGALVSIPLPSFAQSAGSTLEGFPESIGARYLQLVPQEASVAALTQALGDLMNRSPQEFAGGVTETVRADFLQARTLRVAGWILSQTEARLCALHALQLRSGK